MAEKKVKALKLLKGEALMLRTCNADGTSYGGFQWPKSGPVKCPDWKKRAECGNGLHGLLWGEGNGSLLNWSEGAAWLVVRIKESDAVQIGDKIKVPSGVVEFFGKADDAVALIQKYAPAGKAIVRGTATAGDGGTATAGDGGTATAGDGGTATAGVRGTATAGVGGCIAILYWNGEKCRRAVFEVGENGVEPNQPYQVNADGKPVKVEVKP
jgi:hypothetical protein